MLGGVVVVVELCCWLYCFSFCWLLLLSDLIWWCLSLFDLVLCWTDVFGVGIRHKVSVWGGLSVVCITYYICDFAFWCLWLTLGLLCCFTIDVWWMLYSLSSIWILILGWVVFNLLNFWIALFITFMLLIFCCFDLLFNGFWV